MDVQGTIIWDAQIVLMMLIVVVDRSGALENAQVWLSLVVMDLA